MIHTGRMETRPSGGRAATLYEAFGLRMASRLPLPELPLAAGFRAGSMAMPGLADVEIGLTAAEPLLREMEELGSNFSLSRDGRRFLFLIPDTAAYAIEDGRRILVAPLPGADPEKMRVYLLGTCMGALLLLRGTLPLHGSAVVVKGKAYAFVGDSGAGKSTLAAALAAMGHRLVSDDVVAVSLDEAGRPFVQPAYPQQKLWRESLVGLGLSGGTSGRNGKSGPNGTSGMSGRDGADAITGKYRPVYRETDKFAVPAGGSFHLGPVPLAGVFELGGPRPGTKEGIGMGVELGQGAEAGAETGTGAGTGARSGAKAEPEAEKGAETGARFAENSGANGAQICTLEPLFGLQCLRVLLQHTYRNRLVARLGREDWHFRAASAVTAKIEVGRLQRPQTGFTANALARLVVDHATRSAR
ncbi:HPr kinase/phosphorylase [Cohnella fermenti]|uniref:Aldolase n=1 Tax=Cohnella fermenti TaxID=2565925 RepID=A0A4S4BGS7_9BACL|nr:hypothetical protein [Cohnella fermenti]THF73670.1 hypothetical protein E6C55_28200 [Cohnella fermenti]